MIGIWLQLKQQQQKKRFDQPLWRTDVQFRQQSSEFGESIPSMHFTPVNANAQRTVFEHLNHGPVPVRGAQLHGGHKPLNQQAIESRQFLQNTAIFKTFQTVPGQRLSTNANPFQQPPTSQSQNPIRFQGFQEQDESRRPSRPQLRRQQAQPNFQSSFPSGPAAAAPPSHNNRQPIRTRPQLTGISQTDNTPLTDSFDTFDDDDDEQQTPTVDWNRPQQNLRQPTRRYRDTFQCWLNWLFLRLGDSRSDPFKNNSLAVFLWLASVLVYFINSTISFSWITGFLNKWYRLVEN